MYFGEYVILNFVEIYLGENCSVMGYVYYKIYKKLHAVFQHIVPFTFPQAMHEGPSAQFLTFANT